MILGDSQIAIWIDVLEGDLCGERMEGKARECGEEEEGGLGEEVIRDGAGLLNVFQTS